MIVPPHAGPARNPSVFSLGLRTPNTAYAVIASGLLLATGAAWGSHLGGSAGSSGGAPSGRHAQVTGAERCTGHTDTLRLDSLPWPLDSLQAVRRATLALQGATALQLPVRVARYVADARRVRLRVLADVEPRVVLRCGSGDVAIHADGVTVVEARTTAGAAGG
jgi:hypothetical protein